MPSFDIAAPHNGVLIILAPCNNRAFLQKQHKRWPSWELSQCLAQANTCKTRKAFGVPALNTKHKACACLQGFLLAEALSLTSGAPIPRDLKTQRTGKGAVSWRERQGRRECSCKQSLVSFEIPKTGSCPFEGRSSATKQGGRSWSRFGLLRDLNHSGP